MNKNDPKNAILQELKESPYRKFNVAVSLMTVIPFLAFLYILISKYGSFDILVGEAGGIFFICIIVALSGFLIGYFIINNILKKLIFYAMRFKESDQKKSSLVASVSHELKNPIAVIKTNLFTVSAEALGFINEQQKKILDLCLRVVDRMNSLINDLLDLHKIEAGAVDMKRHLCDLVNILDSQIKEFEAMASQKDIKLIMDINRSPEKMLSMWVDEEKITRVVNNLISNAIKYTPDGRSVNIKAHTCEGFVRLEIADAGPGIPQDKLEKIFDKFERLDTSKEGTGLGLAITKDIVELHRGRIWAESLPESGSKFIVVLPRDLRQRQR